MPFVGGIALRWHKVPTANPEYAITYWCDAPVIGGLGSPIQWDHDKTLAAYTQWSSDTLQISAKDKVGGDEFAAWSLASDPDYPTFQCNFTITAFQNGASGDPVTVSATFSPASCKNANYVGWPEGCD